MKTQVTFAGCATTAALVIGVTACGVRTSPTQGVFPATTSTMSSAASARDAATASARAAPATAGASGALAGIPVYQPSTIVSRTGGAVVLMSPDPVAKVTAFYMDAVDKGGWSSVSKTLTDYNNNLTLGRAGHGAAISISPSGSGSLISISTYPTP